MQINAKNIKIRTRKYNLKKYCMTISTIKRATARRIRILRQCFLLTERRNCGKI